MNFKSFYYFLLVVSVFSCDSLSGDADYNGYRNGSDSGILINNGSLIGSWEKTFSWNNGGGEFATSWDPVDTKYSDNYIFNKDKTFTSTKKTADCLESSGTYSIDGKKLTLIYNCTSNTTKEIVIDEFFFREKYIVFIRGNGTNNISKLELVK